MLSKSSVPAATHLAPEQQPPLQPLRQQGCPTSPQAAQVPLTQLCPGAVQWLKGPQQGCPGPPHVPQEPLAQTAPPPVG